MSRFNEICGVVSAPLSLLCFDLMLPFPKPSANLTIDDVAGLSAREKKKEKRKKKKHEIYYSNSQTSHNMLLSKVTESF